MGTASADHANSNNVTGAEVVVRAALPPYRATAPRSATGVNSRPPAPSGRMDDLTTEVPADAATSTPPIGITDNNISMRTDRNIYRTHLD